MTIELKFRSVTIQAADMQENYPLIFSALQPYLPVQKPPKRRRPRRPRRKRETVANLIDPIIDSIENSG